METITVVECMQNPLNENIYSSSTVTCIDFVRHSSFYLFILANKREGNGIYSAVHFWWNSLSSISRFMFIHQQKVVHILKIVAKFCSTFRHWNVQPPQEGTRLLNEHFKQFVWFIWMNFIAKFIHCQVHFFLRLLDWNVFITHWSDATVIIWAVRHIWDGHFRTGMVNVHSNEDIVLNHQSTHLNGLVWYKSIPSETNGCNDEWIPPPGSRTHH